MKPPPISNIPDVAPGSLGPPRAAVKDTELTFIMQVYRDFAAGEWVLKRLQQFYTGSRVIIIADGDTDQRLNTLQGCEIVFGERLYALEHGGRMIQRMLKLFLERPTKYLFKVDTDTGFHRRFRYLPSDDGIFGTVQRAGNGLCSVQGGCVGWTANAARRLYCSNILLSTALLDYRSSWAAGAGVIQRWVEETGRMSFDWVLGHSASISGIRQFNFPEVRCNWRHRVANTNWRYAITHPCKNFTL